MNDDTRIPYAGPDLPGRGVGWQTVVRATVTSIVCLVAFFFLNDPRTLVFTHGSSSPNEAGCVRCMVRLPPAENADLGPYTVASSVAGFAVVDWPRRRRRYVVVPEYAVLAAAGVVVGAMLLATRRPRRTESPPGVFTGG